jgi:long-chain acyl-CoA synthetase
MAGCEIQVETLIDLFGVAVASEKRGLLNYKHDGAWREIPARALAEKVRATAMGLYALGVRAGDRVGLLSENRPEWTMADLGALHCGAADVPIYATQAPKQVAYILNDAGVEVLFIASAAQYERVKEALAAAPKLRAIIASDRFETSDERVIHFGELLRRGREADEAEPCVYETLRRGVKPGDLATLIYTSGTTGEPKGVMLTHRNLVSNVLSNCRVLALEEDDVVLSFLPLSHIFERMALYLYLYRRAAIYYAESIDLVAQNLAEVRPHVMTSVPRLFEKIYAKTIERAEAGGKLKGWIAHWAAGVAAEWAKMVSRGGRAGWWLDGKRRLAVKLVFSKWRAGMGGRIRYFISGGAPLATELARIFYGAGLPILQGYGMTESSPVITANTPEENRLGSVGKPIPGVTVRIAADGEVLCSGPNVMLGYYHKPEATAEALTLDGEGRLWLHTGDVGYLDDDGFLFITDRKKDLLKTSGGKFIAPQPIENAIKRSRFVNQVVVIGDERKFPAALIVPNLETLRGYAALKGIAYRDTIELLGHPQIINLLERQVDKFTPDLAHFEKIKAVALLEREFTIESGELTPTLKVKRRVVAEKYKTLIDRLYAAKEELHALRSPAVMSDER